MAASLRPPKVLDPGLMPRGRHRGAQSVGPGLRELPRTPSMRSSQRNHLQRTSVNKLRHKTSLGISLSVVSSSTSRRIMRRIWRPLLGLVVVLLVLAIVGAIYQAIATELAERAYPPPGEMVDVGGYSLHINCVGQGSPTVVLDGGSGEWSAQWVRVQREVSDTTRVCAYDRAGMGWSEMGPDPRDAKQVTGELHTLLGKAGIESLTCWWATRSAACTCKRTPPGIPTRWQAWPWSIRLPSRINSASDRKDAIATNHKSRGSPWVPSWRSSELPCWRGSGSSACCPSSIRPPLSCRTSSARR